MRTIHKGPGPATLTAYRGDPHATWDNYPCKDDARAVLCEEQGYLCAFCCGRIEPVDANLQVKLGIAPDRNRGMRCAHWMPQSVDGSKQLIWKNLLGACFGGEGSDVEHCDVAQKDHTLKIHPVSGNPSPEAVFTYGSDGSMHGLTEDAGSDIKVLNLDKPERLRRSRKAVWKAIYDLLQHRSGTRTVPELTRMREAALTPKAGRLEPFVNVAVFILERQIQRHGGGR